MPSNPLRPLRHGPYRLLAVALSLSLVSYGMWTIAVVWLVIGLGGGPAQVSLVSAVGAAGLLVPALLGGVVADRVRQRRILLAVSTVKTATFLALAGLALAGAARMWHLAVAALAVGVTEAFFYPAYSAWLPALVPAEDLLAVNGLEGMLRPGLAQAIGPALAGALVAAGSPGAALLAAATCEAVGIAVLARMARTAVRRDLSQQRRHPAREALSDLREGLAYLARTPWLLATLLFASVLVLLIMGPIEVLVPFVVKDRVGGGASEHALVLAGFGVGGAVASLAAASLRLPRRYLTVMNLAWGIGCLPLVAIGLSTSLSVQVAAAALLGATFSGPSVIWGTLLQRRVPADLLGRVSSLDFFVSLALMPVSMAVAGPVAAAIGLGPTFVLAGTAPTLFAVVAIVAARMPADELAHPLDLARAPAPGR